MMTPTDEPIALNALRRAARRLKRRLVCERDRWAARQLNAALSRTDDHVTVLRYPEEAGR